ncbi:MAG: RagB/SusD family nutrient uptake outer membrane protein, partial [Gemmatimonadota bacterium]|nr:RagB/SusD family nutrient uptake outer membrane protein [Gemmatimonadota bacterium]
RDNWTAAVADAAQVPTDFEYVAFFAVTSGRENNVIWDETWGREEMSAFNTLADRLGPDPRAPWVDEGATGADGVHPHYKQTKYSDLGSDIPVVKGTEMRLIEAEAFLRNSDLGNAVLKIDEARAEYGLGNVTPAPTTINDAWVLLDNERLLTLWMEGRRWHDARRWDEAGMSFMPAVQYVYGNSMSVYNDPTPLTPIFEKDVSLSKRAACIPISLAECDTNENLVGAPECAGAFVAP